MIRPDCNLNPDLVEALFRVAGGESSASLNTEINVKRKSAFSLEVVEFYLFTNPYISCLDSSGAELHN